jgi:ferredoxin
VAAAARPADPVDPLDPPAGRRVRRRRRRGAPPPVELTIDGQAVSVPAGSTILERLPAQGIDTPTLCYLENLTPVNVCRVCVVEVTGSRVLVPACSRKVEAGMDVQTDSERVRHARKMVLEFPRLVVDLSTAPSAPGLTSSATPRDTSRYGRARRPGRLRA